MPEQPFDRPDLGEVADNIQAMSEFFGGQRRALMNQGYTDREAAQIVVGTCLHLSAQAWIEVGQQWGLSS